MHVLTAERNYGNGSRSCFGATPGAVTRFLPHGGPSTFLGGLKEAPAPVFGGPAGSGSSPNSHLIIRVGVVGVWGVKPRKPPVEKKRSGRSQNAATGGDGLNLRQTSGIPPASVRPLPPPVVKKSYFHFVDLGASGPFGPHLRNMDPSNPSSFFPH